MRRLARIVLIFLFFFLASTILPKTIFAEGEFETDYKVFYQVDSGGKTKVTQDITLKNKTTNYYADMFELKIGSTKVENVKAQDISGPLETSVKFENNVTTIGVHFKQKVIGVGKALNWNLSYESSELAFKSGQIWEVSIPRLAKSTEINSYQTTLSIPRTFGPVAFAVPTPKTSTQTFQNQEFTFDKNQLITSGIAMSFGEKQVFAFNLNYHLQNDNLTTQIFQISLPPDNNYQKIVLEKVEPKPLDITVDKDGNFLAKYKLASRDSIDINTQGYVEVFSQPFRNIYKSLSQEQKNKYLEPQKYWEVDNASINDKAKELKTAENIYDYVSKYLTYNEEKLKKSKLERMGAQAILNDPQNAVCTEFTDLFIALARAAGIPAREVEGYAYTQNERLRPLSLALNQGETLHAWPEYWDDTLGWVQIDPTWGATSGGLDYFHKLDFNHITFVQRGISSTTPYPAGAYKKEEQPDKKYVFVSFAEKLPEPTRIPQLSLFSPTKIISAIPFRIEAEVQNIGTSSIIGQKLSLGSSKLKSSLPSQIEIDILPPFSKRDFSFNLYNKNLLLNTQDTLILSYADVQIAKPIQILPFYRLAFSENFLLSISLATLIIVAGLYLYKKTHKIHSPFTKV